MSRHESVPEPWFSFLKELDELATTTVSFHCIGGFVVTMLYGLGRTTGDLDVLEIAPKSAGDAFAKVARQGGELHRKYKVYLDQVGVTQPPYDYESRLREMLDRGHRRRSGYPPSMILRSRRLLWVGPVTSVSPSAVKRG